MSWGFLMSWMFFFLLLILANINSANSTEEQEEKNRQPLKGVFYSQENIEPFHDIVCSINYQPPTYYLRDISYIQIAINTHYTEKIKWQDIKSGVKDYIISSYPVFNLDEELYCGFRVMSTYSKNPVWQGPTYSNKSSFDKGS
jgi:hypothetical protein